MNKQNKAKLTEYITMFCFLAILAVVGVEVFARVNGWVFASIVILYFLTFRLSGMVGKLHQRLLIDTNSLAVSLNLLAESCNIQSERTTDIQQFIKKLIAPKAKLDELPIH